MKMVPWLRTATALCAAALALSTAGCGLAAAAAAAALTDAVSGGGGGGGSATILRVENDAGSLDHVVEIRTARTDAVAVPKSWTADVKPGDTGDLRNKVDPGTYWVSVGFSSGFRTRPRSLVVLKDQTVTLAVAHLTPAFSLLAGTWNGACEDHDGTLHTVGVTLDGSGHASGRTLDGTASPATGTLSEVSEGVFRIAWSDASTGLLTCDGARAHAGLVVEGATWGVVEKGASATLPTYADGDAVGSFTGVHLAVTGSAFTVDALLAGSATVSAQHLWQGEDGEGSTSTGDTPFLADSTAFGRFSCDYEDEATNPGTLTVFLSADKTFAFGTLEPDTATTFPDDVVFLALEKGL